MKWFLDVDSSWPEGYDPVGINDGYLDELDPSSDVEHLRFNVDHTIATPGWINSHSHLELTGCPPIEFNGNFVDWIKDVLQFKLSLEREDLQENYRQGSNSLVESGVAHVVDHCDRTDWVLGVVDQVPVSVYLMKELIAFTEEQIQTVKREADDFLSSLDEKSSGGGLAPHAPYSAHPDVYEFVNDRIKSSDFAESSHLHEVEGEFDFVENGTGPFADLLEERTGQPPVSPYKNGRPLPELVDKGFLNEPMFGIHMNYMTDEDYRWLEASRVVPVFCPRSYRYFQHDTLPIRNWIEREIPFAMGTDSSASNDGLDMMEELRLLTNLLPENYVEPEMILKALTVNPSRVLNEPDRGVLSLGTPADLSVFHVPSGSPEALVRGDAEPVAVIRDGVPRWVDESKVSAGQEVIDKIP